MTATASMDAFTKRVNWARHYVDELEEATDALMGDGRDGTAIDYKQDNNAGRICVSVHLPNGFSDDFERIIAGAFHELRSAFDNLAYQLVLAKEGTPTSKTDFPILWEEPKPEFAAATKRRLEGMSDTARATIERLQPFNEWPERPKDTTLWLIHELNNIDKHRIAHLACLWIAHCHGTLYGKGASAEQIGGRIEHVHPRGIAEHKATLLDFRWHPMLRYVLRNPEMMMEIDLSAEVALRSPEREWFLDPDRIPTRALPLTHFFNAALRYCETTIAPAFAEEFK